MSSVFILFYFIFWSSERRSRQKWKSARQFISNSSNNTKTKDDRLVGFPFRNALQKKKDDRTIECERRSSPRLGDQSATAVRLTPPPFFPPFSFSIPIVRYRSVAPSVSKLKQKKSNKPKKKTNQTQTKQHRNRNQFRTRKKRRTNHPALLLLRLDLARIEDTKK